ncbi:MAG: hypothetical protein AAGL24_28445 [Pseudomonadota bacterium]
MIRRVYGDGVNLSIENRRAVILERSTVFLRAAPGRGDFTLAVDPPIRDVGARVSESGLG